MRLQPSGRYKRDPPAPIVDFEPGPGVIHSNLECSTSKRFVNWLA